MVEMLQRLENLQSPSAVPTMIGSRAIADREHGVAGVGVGLDDLFDDERHPCVTLAGTDKTVNRTLEASARALAGTRGYVIDRPDPHWGLGDAPAPIA